MGPSTAFSCDAAHARERMLIDNKPLPSASNQNLQILHGSVVQESIRLITVLQEEHEYLTRIIHERFCCNRRSAVASSPQVSRRGSAISRRTVMNNAG